MGEHRLRWLWVPFGILAGSQLGHALVYWARYGAAAARYESAGMHGYYPALTAGIGAALGVVLLAALLLAATARSTLLAPPGSRPRLSVRYLDVLAVVFVAQLVVFVGQESIESLAAGHAVPSLIDQLLWGTVGQLPAAALAAAAIVWLLARLDAAWSALVAGVPQLLVAPEAPVSVLVAARVDARLRLVAAFPSAFRKRGPPRPSAGLN